MVGFDWRRTDCFVNNGNYIRYQVTGEPIVIPRDGFMLFRADATKDNPEGVSPLSNCYIAYRFHKELGRD